MPARKKTWRQAQKQTRVRGGEPPQYVEHSCRTLLVVPGQTHSRNTPPTGMMNLRPCVTVYRLPEETVYNTTEGGRAITVTSHVDVGPSRRSSNKERWRQSRSATNQGAQQASAHPKRSTAA